MKNDGGSIRNLQRDLDLAETERHFQTRVVDLARSLGWRVVHFRPARTATGWVTAIQGDKGFPDTVLARQGTVWFWELKRERGGRTDADQEAWGEALGSRYRSLRPSDWEWIVGALTVGGRDA